MACLHVISMTRPILCAVLNMLCTSPQPAHSPPGRPAGLNLWLLISMVLQVRPKKKHVQPEARQLTQEELLAEAAQTEIDNIKSLQVLPGLPAHAALWCHHPMAGYHREICIYMPACCDASCTTWPCACAFDRPEPAQLLVCMILHTVPDKHLIRNRIGSTLYATPHPELLGMA